MEFDQVILRRRSIRSYESRPVSDALLEDIIRAGLHAPSGDNLQPWYFVAVRSPAQMARLTEIMGRVAQAIEPTLYERFERHPQIARETTRFIRQMGGAPVCVLAFQLRENDGKTASAMLQGVAAAIENILLSAVDKGLGGCWLTAPLETGADAELRAAFAPGKGPLVALFTLGYPKGEPKALPRKEGRYVIV